MLHFRGGGRSKPSLCDHLSSHIWHNLVVGPFKREALGALLNLLLPKSELNQRRSSLSFSSEVEVNQMAASSAESRGAAPASPPVIKNRLSRPHAAENTTDSRAKKCTESVSFGQTCGLSRKASPRVTESGL